MSELTVFSLSASDMVERSRCEAESSRAHALEAAARELRALDAAAERCARLAGLVSLPPGLADLFDKQAARSRLTATSGTVLLDRARGAA